jgi:hypothetical protein
MRRLVMTAAILTVAASDVPNAQEAKKRPRIVEVPISGNKFNNGQPVIIDVGDSVAAASGAASVRVWQITL